MDITQQSAVVHSDNVNPLLQCPYNPSHRVLRSRIQMHLVNCRKAHPSLNKEICPFNAVHHVNKEDLRQHMSTCPDRRLIEAHHYELAHQESGSIAQTLFEMPILSSNEENWDAEEHGHDLAHEGANRSEQRALRYQERVRPSQVAASDEASDSSAHIDAPLRLPHTTSTALSLGSQGGMGRGYPALAALGVVPAPASSGWGRGRGHLLSG